MIPIRALKYELKIGDREKNVFFFRTILGMTVFRHEEFKECDEQIENRWSKTVFGYGSGESNFVLELIYNYGISSYTQGNDFGRITIRSKEAVERAVEHDVLVSLENQYYVITSPDGYKFYVISDSHADAEDAIVEVCLHSTNLEASSKYWVDLLGMNVVAQGPRFKLLTYGHNQISLRIRQITGVLQRGTSSGRIAFSIPTNIQPLMGSMVKKAHFNIVKPMFSVPISEKEGEESSAYVIILADPDGHEISFIDEKGWAKMAEPQPNASLILDEIIATPDTDDKVHENTDSDLFEDKVHKSIGTALFEGKIDPEIMANLKQLFEQKNA